MNAPKDPGRRRRAGRAALPIWKKLLFALVITGVFLAALPYAMESVLYLQNPDLVYGGFDEGVTVTWGHPIVRNSLGFREREFVTPKPPDTFRIMVLGDSFTIGAGLAEAERYSNLLEDMLDPVSAPGTVEVLNFGVSGSPTVAQRELLEEHVDLVDPDLIVVGFCLNDTQPRGQRYSVEIEQYQGLFRDIWKLRGRGLNRTSMYLDSRLEALLVSTGRIPRWEDALQRTYEKDAREWRDFVEALDAICQVSRERGLPAPVFAVLNQGTSGTRPTDYGNPDEQLDRYLAWYHQAESAAAGAGMTALNFEAELARELADEPMGVNALDTHPSVRCNEIYAKKMAGVIAPLVEAAR